MFGAALLTRRLLYKAYVFGRYCRCSSLMLWSVSNRKPVCVVPKAHESGSWVTALVGCAAEDVFV